MTALLFTPVRADNRSRIIQHHSPRTTTYPDFIMPLFGRRHATAPSSGGDYTHHHHRRTVRHHKDPAHVTGGYSTSSLTSLTPSPLINLRQKPPSPTQTPRPRGAATPSTSCESAARARTSRSWCASSARSGFARRRGRMSSRLSADMGTILRMEEGMAIRVMARRRTARTTTTRQRPLSVDDLIGPDQENNVA